MQLYAEEGGEEAWIQSLPGMKAMGELLEKEGGPFFMGSTRELFYLLSVHVSHSIIDHNLLSLLLWLEVLS
jgi:hypothetical protein